MVLSGVDAVVEVAATFLVAAVFYVVTLHLAATFVLGDVPVLRAVLVGPVPALVVVLGAWLGPAWLAAAVAIGADFAAIRWSYEVDDRLAAGVTLGHVVASVLLAASLFGLLRAVGG